MLLAARSVQVDGGRGEALFERSPPVREHGRPVGGEDVLDVLLGQRAKGGREDVAVPGGAGQHRLTAREPPAHRAEQMARGAPFVALRGAGRDQYRSTGGAARHSSSARRPFASTAGPWVVRTYSMSLSLIHISEPTRLGMISY